MLNADAIVGQTSDLLGHNMFAYCENNPINRWDPSGYIWDYLDIGFAAWSWSDFCHNPSLETFLWATVDTVALLPIVPSSGYIRKAPDMVSMADEMMDVVGIAIDIYLPKNRYPETSQHILDAQESGHPDVLTIDRPGAKSRRKESLRGYDKVQGMDLDEYPPAMFREGGPGVSVRPITPSDNRGAGSYIGNKLRKYPNGTRIRISIK